MSVVSEKKWFILRLAACAIAQNIVTLEQLSENLNQNYTDSEIAGIWRQARLILVKEDQYWLEEALFMIFENNSEHNAA